jgi:hypothetical protein
MCCQFHNGRGAGGTRSHVLNRPGTYIDVDHGRRNVETGQLRERDIVVVVVIRVIVIFIGADATVVFKGGPGEMRTEGADTFRLERCLIQDYFQEGPKETYGRCRHETRTGAFGELAKDAVEAHQRTGIWG